VHAAGTSQQGGFSEVLAVDQIHVAAGQVMIDEIGPDF
jgi:hypothetical protein